MPSDRPPLTQARLKELLHYDPETGVFTWVLANNNRVRPGKRAGSLSCYGYVRIEIERRRYLAHRLAFLYMTGALPASEVDHVNRCRSDNRWCNLRPATSQQNNVNKGLQRNNTSGVRGVSRHPGTNKWRAHGTLHKRYIHLGFFDSLEEAATAAQKWREENFGIFAAAGQADPALVVSGS